MPVFNIMIIVLIIIITTLIVINLKFSFDFKLLILLITAIILLIPPIYFVILMNDFIEKNPNQFPVDSIVGSIKRDNSIKSWGFGIGWYLPIVSSILMLVVFGINYRLRKQKAIVDTETLHPTIERFPEPEEWSK